MATTNNTLPYILTEDFTHKAEGAWDAAREKALANGIPVLYRDYDTGIQVMEQPDGRLFEIRFNPGAPREHLYDIVRELPPGTIQKCPT